MDRLWIGGMIAVAGLLVLWIRYRNKRWQATHKTAAEQCRRIDDDLESQGL